MILTGPKIREEVAAKRIDIEPYDEKLVGPNSVDLRLAPELRVYAMVIDDQELALDPALFPRPIPDNPEVPALWREPWRMTLDSACDNPTHELSFPETGRVLKPGILYLARTVEVIHSAHYVPILEGRSSYGRLGLSVHVTAGFCDLGFRGTITLEMTVVHQLRVYPNKPICQVFFTRPEGEVELYKGKYQNQHEVTPSRAFKDEK